MGCTSSKSTEATGGQSKEDNIAAMAKKVSSTVVPFEPVELNFVAVEPKHFAVDFPAEIVEEAPVEKKEEPV